MVSPLPALMRFTSTIDDRIGTFDSWTWANVPAGTAFANWTDGGGVTSWQQPVAEVAAFPGNDALLNSSVAVAYDMFGHEL